MNLLTAGSATAPRSSCQLEGHAIATQDPERETLELLFGAIAPAPLTDVHKGLAHAWHAENGHPTLCEIVDDQIVDDLIEAMQLPARSKSRARKFFEDMYARVRVDVDAWSELGPPLNTIKPIPPETVAKAQSWPLASGCPTICDILVQGNVRGL